MSTSYAYDFQNFNTGDLILAAYRRLGIKNSQVTTEDILNAKTELNLIFSHWVNKNTNLFTIEQDLIQLYPGQYSYLLPTATVNVLECGLLGTQRQLGGTAASSSGVAANAFDGNLTTACTQNAPNGWISYDFGVYPPVSPNLGPQIIQFVGILTPVNLFLSLTVQYAITAGVWQDILIIPPQTFNAYEPLWFCVPYQKYAQYWRIIETKGATLNITELYFSQNSISSGFKVLSPAPRDVFFNYQKTTPGSNQANSGTGTYWVNRVGASTLNLYSLPDSTYSHILFNRVRQCQDVGTMLDSQDMTQRFLQSAVYELANVIAYNKNMQAQQLLAIPANQVYLEAANADKDFNKMNISSYNLGAK